MVSRNNLTHIRSFSGGERLVQLDPSVLRGVHAVIIKSYKMYQIFGHGHYDTFVLKQNNLLIIKVSF